MKIATRALIVLGALSTLMASEAAEVAAAPKKTWVQEVKNPTDWLTWGADLRLRNEYLGNAATGTQNALTHERDYFRFRGRIYATIKPVEKLSLNVRVSAEPRQWMKGGRQARPDPWSGNHMDWTEGIIDNLNVKITEPFDLPVSLTLGRQDIFFGDPLDWWLVADATPLDGSRTFFFDAARLTLNLKEQKTTVDLVYIDQSAMNDRWLPPIRHLEKPLIDQDERGFIAYLSNKSIEKMQIDAYFMYKNDNRNYKIADRGLLPGFFSNDGDLYTFGGKLSGMLTPHWKYMVEGAYQVGRIDRGNTGIAKDVDAFGARARLAYLFKDKMNSQVRFNWEYISGDDPNTVDEYEGFDLLWGRWPRWSELYIYTYAPEVRAADNGNVHRFGPGFEFTPVKNLTFNADYNALFAAQSWSTGRFPISTGDFRGHYLQTVLKYKFNQHLSGHLWGEYIWAGDFYATRDLLLFLRAEILLTF